ncbi:MAG: penicillin-binding protein 2 [Lachnospiraceae bacterium]|nr:penicillin-binding protein 2 [Lachnospiraceae bacterium]
MKKMPEKKSDKKSNRSRSDEKKLKKTSKKPAKKPTARKSRKSEELYDDAIYEEELDIRDSDGAERPRNARKKSHNKSILFITYTFVFIFLCMIAYIVKFVVVDSEHRINSPYNKRQDLLAEKIVRGDILSSDGKVLATTVTNSDGTESRNYPYSRLFCHVVGRMDNSRTGLELSEGFSMLRSTTNPLQKLVNDFEGKKSIGDNCFTTLNYELQQTAYDALGSYKGAIVAMEPKTGKILCMISKPDYDPNTVSENWETLNSADEQESALLNRATQGLYPPGSTFKILTALEYMQEYERFNQYTYTCNGTANFHGYAMKCFNGEVHGEVDLTDSMAHSCNNSFANIGLSLDIKKFSATCEKFGYNKSIPFNFEYNKSSFALDKDSKTDEIIQTAIGQGETLVTPLQNLMVISTIANNGEMMLPQLVDHTENTNGKILNEYEEESLGQKCKRKYTRKMKEYLEAVVEYGTATSIKGHTYGIAGKTGSAEIDSTGKSHAWFVGYAPAENPKIAVSIVVEGAGTGSQYAVPIAARMFENYLGY